MTTIERLQALKRSFEASIQKGMDMAAATEHTRGVIKGLSIAVYAIEQEIKMIEAGEGEKA